MSLSVRHVTPDQIATFMQDMIVQYQQVSPNCRRRSEPRESVAIPVRVQPLDDAYQPLGEPFAVVTRDMSCGGVGFFHTERIDAKWIRICLSTPYHSGTMNLLAHIEHCTRWGDFYLVGCSIEDLSAGASDQDA